MLPESLDKNEPCLKVSDEGDVSMDNYRRIIIPQKTAERVKALEEKVHGVAYEVISDSSVLAHHYYLLRRGSEGKLYQCTSGGKFAFYDDFSFTDRAQDYLSLHGCIRLSENGYPVTCPKGL